LNDWERIADMLRAYREQQRSTWGDADDMVVAKYLSGDCSPNEKDVVERAVAQYPALGELVEVLREIAAAPLPGEMPVSRFSPALTTVSAPPISRIWEDISAPVIRLAERLTAWLDDAGRLAAAGLQSVLATPQFATARAMGVADAASEAGKAIWSIPLPDANGHLTLFVGPGRPSGLWSLLVKLDLPGDARLPKDARLEIRNARGRREISGALADFLKEPITLKAGSWQVTVEIGPRALLIPLDLGPPAAAD
jgi:hypothetical protein